MLGIEQDLIAYQMMDLIAYKIMVLHAILQTDSCAQQVTGLIS